MDSLHKRQLEQALRAAEASFRYLADNLPGLMFQYVLWPDGQDAIYEMSPRCRELLELEPQAVERDTGQLWSLVAPQDREPLRRSLLRSAHERSPWHVEFRVTTPSGRVDAREVVLACGGYLARLHRRVDAGVLPIATYVMVTEPLGARMDTALRTRAAIYDTRFAFDYYRPLPDSRLLWGGRISVLDRSPRSVERLLYGDMLKVFPQLEGVRIDHAWSGLMSYARHEMPQIGQVEPGLWVAQAFGGHGVAPTTFAGEVIASAIAQGDRRWCEFAAYGLVSAMKPAGFLGAQVSYWWAEAKDAWKARKGRREGA